MALELYFHPFSSFCQKALIALYENGTPFERNVVDLGDEASRAAFARVWPLAKFPVLRDHARQVTVPESSIVIEYVGQHYPGPVELLPKDPDLAIEVRHWDRFFDSYVQVPMQKIVTDRLRPPGSSDAFGVEGAKNLLATAYGMLEERMSTRIWAAGNAFTMADCAAAPALMYANKVFPLGDHRHVAAYLDRLEARESYARVLAEAAPYWEFFPKER